MDDTMEHAAGGHDGDRAHGQEQPDVLLDRAIDLVAAYVTNHQVSEERLVPLIREIFTGIRDLRRAGSAQTPAKAPPPGPRPAVPVGESFDDDTIWCLECGKKLTTLKRHLNSQHQMTPAEYRAKWNLPLDYPMVALNYSRARSRAAMASGLGKKQKPEDLSGRRGT